MSLESLLQHAAEGSGVVTAVNGEWRCIQMKLGSFSPEHLNIGIVFQEPNSPPVIRLLEDFSGLECLLQDQFSSAQFSYLLGAIKESMTNSASILDVATPSPAINFTRSGIFSGNSSEEIVNWLFDECVTLGHRKKHAFRGFRHKDNEEVRGAVISSIRKIKKLEADRFLVQSGVVRIVDESNKDHHLEIPLMNNKKIGTIASAWYSSWSTIRGSLLGANIDLGTAAKHYRLEPAMFIQRPSETAGIPKKELDKIDDKFDELIWKFRRGGIHCDVEDSAEKLAEEIIAWAGY